MHLPECLSCTKIIEWFVGAGQSGSLAAYLFSNSSPDNKIFIIDNDIIIKLKTLKKISFQKLIIF